MRAGRMHRPAASARPLPAPRGPGQLPRPLLPPLQDMGEFLQEVDRRRDPALPPMSATASRLTREQHGMRSCCGWAARPRAAPREMKWQGVEYLGAVHQVRPCMHSTAWGDTAAQRG